MIYNLNRKNTTDGAISVLLFTITVLYKLKLMQTDALWANFPKKF